MKILRAAILIGFLLSLPASLSAQKVMIDFDHSANFSQYKTYHCRPN
jgi:hypothetical protein